MGKASEPLYTPAKTTDDEDDEELASDLIGDNGGSSPARYSDNPNGRYRDDPSDTKGKGMGKKGKNDSDVYHFDAESEVPFSPVNLDDSDEDEDDEDEQDDDDGRAKPQSQRKNNKNRMKQRVWDEEGDDNEYGEYDESERLFVGGGWGRHGSQVSCWTRRVCCWVSCIFNPCKVCGLCGGPKTSKGPSAKNKSGLVQMACMMIGFLALVGGSIYLGYEAGLPAENQGEVNIGDESDAEGAGKHHVVTKGEEWLHHPLDLLPHVDWHWNATEHFPHFHKETNQASNGKGAPSSTKGEPQILTNSQLLHLSEHIFQTCSERSLLTTPGRNSCLQLCHGHFCCFEKDPSAGSCITEPYAYCFAYAACENAITDFGMNNVNTAVKNKPLGQGGNEHDGRLDAKDVQLLMDTCSEDNVGTLDGIRDCTAFCQHHLCCFSEDEGENCRADHPGECQAYEACEVLVSGPEDNSNSGAAAAGGTSAGSTSGASASNTSHRPTDIVTAVDSACNVEEKRLDDDSWVTTCHSICANYLCCFSTDGTQSNCRDLYGDEVCDAYEGCKILHASSLEEEEEEEYVVNAPQQITQQTQSNQQQTQQNVQQQPPPQEPQTPQKSDWDKVNEYCTEQVRKDSSLREQCRLACQSRSCCYQQGPGNCYMLDTDWCDEFAACEVLNM